MVNKPAASSPIVRTMAANNKLSGLQLGSNHAAGEHTETVNCKTAGLTKISAIEMVTLIDSELHNQGTLSKETIAAICPLVDRLHREDADLAAPVAVKPRRDELWMSAICDSCENGERCYQIGKHWYHNINDADCRCLGMDALLTVNKWAADSQSRKERDRNE